MNIRVLKCLLILLSLMFISIFCVAEEFPYREQYPDASVIELKDARNSYEKKEILFVDARPKVEFDTFHPKGAVNIDFSQEEFLDIVLLLRKNNPGKKIAVYGDGVACLKSYRAAQDASDEEIDNVYAYDAGVEAWIASYPSDTVLMGQQALDPTSQLLTEEELKTHTIDFVQFKQKVNELPSATVFDIRNPLQRKKKIPGLEQVIAISLEKFIRNVVSKGNMKDRQLFIVDQTGSQAYWLTHYLKKNGYSNFYFLIGGAEPIFNDQASWQEKSST